MRVISNFHDYYDTAMAHGQDSETVFLRQTSETFDLPAVPAPEFKLDHSVVKNRKKRDWNLNRAHLVMSTLLVGLSGKLYRGLMFRASACPRDSRFIEGACVWSAEKAEKEVEARLYKGLPETWGDPMKKAWNNTYYINRASLEKFFEGNGETVLPPNYFLKHNAPIWMFDPEKRKVNPSTTYWESVAVINPKLADLNFYQALSAPQAFQEISMYLNSTLLTGGPKIVTITDDKVKAAKAGFDDTSFRNIAPGPRKARRANKA